VLGPTFVLGKRLELSSIWPDRLPKSLKSTFESDYLLNFMKEAYYLCRQNNVLSTKDICVLIFCTVKV
jgi:hypothetical protein